MATASVLRNSHTQCYPAVFLISSRRLLICPPAINLLRFRGHVHGFQFRILLSHLPAFNLERCPPKSHQLAKISLQKLPIVIEIASRMKKLLDFLQMCSLHNRRVVEVFIFKLMNGKVTDEVLLGELNLLVPSKRLRIQKERLFFAPSRYESPLVAITKVFNTCHKRLELTQSLPSFLKSANLVLEEEHN